MPAAVYNFIIEQGSDFSIEYIYTDENGNPVDLTNKCIVFQFAFPDTVLSFGQCAFYTLSSQANSNYDTDNWSISANNLGVITIKISAEITKNFVPAVALYDLDIISATDKLRNIRLATGNITVTARNFGNQNLTGCPSSIDICSQIYAPIPTPSPSAPEATAGITPTPSSTASFEDLCLPYDCLDLDVYSKVYNGSGIIITDLSTVSGSVTTIDNRNIENVEIAINKLSHSSPSDLQFILAPPSGNKILLSANHKISNYVNNFTYMFSNKASSGIYLHNAINGDSVNIYDKTNIINYNNEVLNSSMNHLFNNSVTGVWTLYIKDTDPMGSGSIDSWKLIITHSSDEE